MEAATWTREQAPQPVEEGRQVRCVCLECGAHVMAVATAATLGGNCGNCGSYDIQPLDE